MRVLTTLCLLLLLPPAFANPHWNPQKAPKDSSYASSRLRLAGIDQLKTVPADRGSDILSIQVDWQEGEQYTVSKIVMDTSGTPALVARSAHKPKWGSYLGILKDSSGQNIYYDSVGTGREYRKLTRAMSFRFPLPTQNMIFEMYAENPQSGVMEKVITTNISMKRLPPNQPPVPGIEVKELAIASKSPSLRVNFYAEGYSMAQKELFWQHAQKAVRTLQGENFPGVAYMSFYAVFHESKTSLGRAKDLGLPIPNRDSFLGLYFPYWDNFGRWNNVIYPTREGKLRYNLASVPYDYPIVLVNSDGYWGVGNYMAFTAIPAANNYYFNYLLLHEFGHFFGLNEEYQGGGRTELEFAPGIAEPWSPNITFLTDKRYEHLKWNMFVSKQTHLPTPRREWQDNPARYGAYLGGYADSTSTLSQSHIPGLNCTMESKKHFCGICRHGIEEVIAFSLGRWIAR